MAFTLRFVRSRSLGSVLFRSRRVNGAPHTLLPGV
jgi:hypothetical protein